MEVPKENSSGIFGELDIGSSTETFQKFLESQKDLFHSQIDQLQNIVVTQCKLTGVNPLSQEMAAGSLSIKIGKRPRDLLNPKAVKYMQSVFSIKDTISKKESREISALCGVTVSQGWFALLQLGRYFKSSACKFRQIACSQSHATSFQVREFFASQRSRVRKIVRLSREKVIRSNSCNAAHDCCSTSSDPAMPIDQVPLNTVDPNTVEQASLCSTQEETIPGIDDSEKTFVENIFNLMRKEEAFAGQVKLMEWILKIQNSSVLNWFLTKGGLMILATWLSQAALEEQTTALLVILKVLCHLPLHKSLPAQMSAILQTVNRLRFYRTPDISNRARVLLSRLSKIFVRSQALKKPDSTISPGDAQKEIIRKQRHAHFFSSYSSKVDIPVSSLWKSNGHCKQYIYVAGASLFFFLAAQEEILALTCESSEAGRKLEPPQTLKLLSASTDDSNRKHIRSASSPQIRERRKVLLVEQPGQKTASRSLQVARVVPANQGRPMSADDIQKAKMRAMFMQSKYGKTGSSSNGSHQPKTEDPNKFYTSQISNLLPLSRTLFKPKNQEDTKSAVHATKASTLPETSCDPKPSSDTQEPSWEKLKRDQIPWQMPPEVGINCLWRVGAGEKSKEVEVQTGRIRREKETIYHSIRDIPSDPKEPWDLEMDYDDTLTPEIPIEQLPDPDGGEALASPRDNQNTTDASVITPAQISNGNDPEPDLELLAVLLKNPELVFALTSGQGGNLSTAETVKLLDMIKSSGIGLPGILNGLSGQAEKVEEVITSLPSPTPSSNPLMGGWRSEGSRDTFSQPGSTDIRDATTFPAVPMLERFSATSLVSPQIPTTNFTLPQQLPTSFYPRRLSPEKQPPAVIPFLHQNPPNISPLQQTPAPESVLHVKHFPVTSSRNFTSAGTQSLRVDMPSYGQNSVKPAAVSIVLNPPERQSITLPLLPTPPRPQQPPLLPEPPVFTPLYPTWPQNAADHGKQAYVPDSRSGRQGSASNHYPQANQNNYNAYPGELVQHSLLPSPHWERNDFVGEPDFEMWSPERSPVRFPENQSGRNFPEQRRRDSDWNPRPGWSRQWSSGHRDHNRHGNRRWRNRRR
ncbi:hypothetical protein HHK36_020761 [Tetracentron sinense]|uniref:Uncharacterized protein n=1 Tax=Tetracentron sinense TaxID=13715 RepID=A0A834YUK7_TETSI|nr:hypothetical protein HHK36_020761 [Tetracentron sinense]